MPVTDTLGELLIDYREVRENPDPTLSNADRSSTVKCSVFSHLT